MKAALQERKLDRRSPATLTRFLLNSDVVLSIEIPHSRYLQPLNALAPIVVTVYGMLIERRLTQL